MGREQSGDIGYEWVNAWAATAMAETSAAMKGEAPAAVAPRVDVAPKVEPATTPAPAFVITAPDQACGFRSAVAGHRRDRAGARCT